MKRTEVKTIDCPRCDGAGEEKVYHLHFSEYEMPYFYIRCSLCKGRGSIVSSSIITFGVQPFELAKD
jgi:hypothetical protein